MSKQTAVCLVTVVCVLLWEVNISSAQTDDNPTYSAMGSAVSNAIMSEWMFAFKLLKPTRTFLYRPSGSMPGIKGLLINNNIDFAVSDAPISVEQQQWSCPENDTIQVPFLATPEVFFYNLPYGPLAFNGNSRKGGKLILDRKTAAAIWAHQITNWRDPDILALQEPDVAAALPNATIICAVRTTSLLSSGVIFQALDSFARSGNRPWPWGTDYNIPSAFFNASNVYSTDVATGVRSYVTLTPNSIAIQSYAEVIQDGQQNFARMINAHGDLLDEPDLSGAFANSEWDEDLVTTAHIDSRNPGVWPVAILNYIMVRLTRYKKMDCGTRRDLMLFFNWLLTAPEARSRMAVLGYSRISSIAVSKSVARLGALACYEGADPFLKVAALPQHASDAYLGVYILTFILGGITTGMVIYYFYRDWHKIQATAIIFYSILMLGSVFNYASVLMFYKVPTNDHICNSRLWLACLGFTMMLSALFCRGYQIHAVQQTSKKLGAKVKHAVIQTAGNGLIIIIQIILLIIWTSVDPFTAIHDDIDTLEITHRWICHSNQAWTWWGLEIAFIMILLGFGLFVVYRTWDLKHMVKESKWISVSIYNCIVVITLLVALFSAMNVNDDTVFWLAGGATLFLTFTMMMALFLPRVIEARALADMSSTSGSKDASNSHHSYHASKHIASHMSRAPVKSDVSPTLQPRSVMSKIEQPTQSTINTAGDRLESKVSSSAEGVSRRHTTPSVMFMNNPESLSHYQNRTSKFGPGSISPRSMTRNTNGSSPSTPRRFSSTFPNPPNEPQGREIMDNPEMDTHFEPPSETEATIPRRRQLPNLASLRMADQETAGVSISITPADQLV